MERFKMDFAGKTYRCLYLDYYTGEELERALRHLDTNGNVLGLDIETFPSLPFEDHPQGGLSRYLSGIGTVQITDGEKVLVVKTEGGLPDLLKRFIFNHRFVAHNALFELHHLSYGDGTICPNLDCSMMLYSLYCRATSPDRAKIGLESAIFALYGEKIEKESQRSNWKETLSTEQIRYAALDAILTQQLYRTLVPKITDLGLKQVYQLNREAQYPLTEMMVHGIGVDTQAHHDLLMRWQKQKKESKTWLHRVLPKDLNVNSSKQLSDWCKENLGPTQLKDWPASPKTGHLQFNAEALAYRRGIPFVRDLLEYKKYEKRINTYGEKFLRSINPVSQRIHPQFTLCQTDTGRLSCRNPNLQNQPRDSGMRSIFVPDEGYFLVCADYSQIELRCAAQVSGDPVMLEAYREGKDLHRLTAATMAGKEPEEVTKEERQMAKAVNFGLLFGAGARTLQRYARMSYGVDMSYREAEAAVEAFRTAYPGYYEWQQEQGQGAEISLQSKTQLGRLRALPNSGYFTRSMNTPIQGSAAEVVLTALVLLKKNLDGLAYIVNCVHDEILLEVPEKNSQQAQYVLESSMEQAWEAVFPGASSRDLVESHIGNNWEEAK